MNRPTSWKYGSQKIPLSNELLKVKFLIKETYMSNILTLSPNMILFELNLIKIASSTEIISRKCIGRASIQKSLKCRHRAHKHKTYIRWILYLRLYSIFLHSRQCRLYISRICRPSTFIRSRLLYKFLLILKLQFEKFIILI